MKCHLPVLAILVTTTLFATEEDQPKKSDKELIQGIWEVVAIEVGGERAPDDSFKEKRFLIEGDRFSLSGTPKDLRTYRLDQTAKPKAIDLPGSTDGQFAKGIYEMEGDTLRLCFSQSTKLDRPNDFNTEGTKYLCFTLKPMRVADLEGTWERNVKDDEGKPNRIVKQHKSGRTTLSVYDESGKLVHQHQSKYKLSDSSEVRIFSYFDMEATAGPAKGQKRTGASAYVYRIDGDTFYEIHGALRSDPSTPEVFVWKRSKDE